MGLRQCLFNHIIFLYRRIILCHEKKDIYASFHTPASLSEWKSSGNSGKAASPVTSLQYNFPWRDLLSFILTLLIPQQLMRAYIPPYWSSVAWVPWATQTCNLTSVSLAPRSIPHSPTRPSIGVTGKSCNSKEWCGILYLFPAVLQNWHQGRTIGRGDCSQKCSKPPPDNLLKTIVQGKGAVWKSRLMKIVLQQIILIIMALVLVITWKRPHHPYLEPVKLPSHYTEKH